MKKLIALLIILLQGCVSSQQVGNITVKAKKIQTSIGPGVQVWFYKADTGKLIDTTFVAEHEND